MGDLARSNARRVLLQGAVLLAGGMLAGCPPVKPPPATMPARVDPGTAPVIGTEPTAGGIFVSLGTHEPLSGEALAKARLERSAIVAKVRSTPALTSQPASQPSTQAATQKSAEPAEPPPLAVKYYLQGREKFLDGANSQAMDFLDKALALDPNAFTVLRLMGRVCFASSQLARGSLFLQRAYAIEPADVEVNYLLGRYWLERKEFERAISHLAQAEDSPQRAISSAQTPLVSFYLARALQAAGYHKGAAEEYQKFLETINLPVAGYRYDRELNYLIEESWAARLSAAENLALVGDYAGALPLYAAAHRHEPENAFIVSRLVNAEVHAGRADNARTTALELVNQAQGSEESIKLMAWSYKATGRENELLTDLRRRAANDSGDSSAATLTLAAAEDYVGKKAEAFQTLRGYVEKHPNDMTVLARLIKRADSAATFGQLLRVAAKVLQQSPEKHDALLQLFLPATKLPPATAFLKNSSLGGAAAGATEQSPYESYLLGLTCRAQGETEQAENYFREAAKARAFFPAREALVTTLNDQEKFRDASEIIQDAISHNEGGAKAYQLLIESEGAQERLASALKIAREARQKFPDNPEIRLQLATIYRLRGQDDEADGELAALIDASPKYEQAYKSLINALLIRAREDGRDGAKLQLQAVGYLKRLLREIPNSTYGRITAAIMDARNGLEDPEVELRRLVAEHPEDVEALAPLAQIRQALGRPSEAAATLEEPLKTHPTPELTQSLAELYRLQDKPGDALALTEKMMKEHPGNENYAIVHASEVVAQKDRLTNAADMLAADVEKFPKSQALAVALARLQVDSEKPGAAVSTMQSFIQRNGENAQRLYLLSHFQSQAGQEPESEKTLQRVLTLMPDHTGANNDLGYFWADEGKNLAKAQQMIGKALENEPNNSAFLDSLGWVYYKQGKFADAITYFEKAIALPNGMEPEVIQHLGDSLFRAGRAGEATERWLQARTLLVDGDKPLGKDKEKIRAYLDAALAAVKSGSVPALSPVAKDATVSATGTSTAPARQER